MNNENGYQENNDYNNNKKNIQPNFNLFNFLVWGLIFAIFINMGISFLSRKQKIEITYTQLIDIIESENAQDIIINAEDDTVYLTLKKDYDKEAVNKIFRLDEIPEGENEYQKLLDETKIYYTGLVDEQGLVESAKQYNVELTKPPITKGSPILSFVLSWVLPIVIFSSIIRSMTNRMMNAPGLGGGFSNIGKSNATLYNIEKKTKVTFADVAGQEEAKESLLEIVDFLHNPDKYTKIGANQPKGALLVGPPGTGKTMLAKAVAGEANVPFFSLSGSDFVEMFVGVGASRVRDLFEQASKNAPCIVFIDEIDAIGKSRDSRMGGNDEREQTLNQLLAEMDGFDSSKGIVILAATNRPEILDKALLRPGRFDRRIIVEKPDIIGREAILKVYADKVQAEDSINLRQIASITSGASGADLANMVNEAALRAVRMGRSKVAQEDLMESVEVVIAGKEKKDRILSEKEKKMVSYHEVGHALVSALQKHSQPVQKITIVPRTMGALGYIMQMPEEEKYLMTKEELLAEIRVMLGGRAAEEVIFNTKTTGASNDIERATKLARSMVTQYGMSDRFNVMGLESIENAYLDGRAVQTCSESTGIDIDKEVYNIMEGCYKECVELLENNKTSLDMIASYLYDKETITGEEFMSILEDSKKLN